MEDKGVEDRLEALLNRVSDWLKYEEAKNGALVTLDGVGVGVVLQWLSTSSDSSVSFTSLSVTSLLLKASVVALLVSLLVALVSFYPLIGRRKRKPNVLFFADIATTKPEDYLKDLRAAVSGAGGTTVELAYAEEIVSVAKLAVMKLRVFRVAFIVSFLALFATCVTAVLHVHRAS